MLTRSFIKKTSYTSKCLIRSFSDYSGVMAGKIINPMKFNVEVECQNDRKGLLADLMAYINNINVDVGYIKSKVNRSSEGKVKNVTFDMTLNTKSEKHLDTLEEDLQSKGFTLRKLDMPTVPWMPLKMSDLDCMGTDLHVADQGLNDDHPGFQDHEYRKRRDEIASLGIGYQMGDKIKDYEYSDEDNQLWNTIWTNLKPKVLEHGCEVYV